MFVGYVQLGDTLNAAVLFRDASRTPTNADGSPTFRVYGPEGLIPAATAAASFLDSGTITGASNAAPIVVTSVGHGLSTGVYVTVAGVGGNSGANGSTTVTKVDADHFSLDGSSGTGAYTSGGSWNVAGLYGYSVVASAADGFEVGQSYEVVIRGAVGGVQSAETQVFIVV